MDVPSTSTQVETPNENRSPWPNRIKAACFITTSAFFGLGIRAAYKQAKPLDPHELSKAKLLSGVGFASRTLGIATLLSVSGFSLFVIGVSALIDVNTPKQFGHKMKNAFGDKMKVKGSQNSESFETLSELFESANKTTAAKAKI